MNSDRVSGVHDTGKSTLPAARKAPGSGTTAVSALKTGTFYLLFATDFAHHRPNPIRPAVRAQGAAGSTAETTSPFRFSNMNLQLLGAFQPTNVRSANPMKSKLQLDSFTKTKRIRWASAFALFVSAVALPRMTLHAAVMDTLYVSVNHSTPSPASTGLILEYTPAGTKSTFASGMPHPRGLAFDTAGNLFAASSNFETNQAKILKFTPDGMQSTFANSTDFLSNVRIDGAGNLFVTRLDRNTPNESTSILKFTPDGTVSTFASGFGASAGLAFDHAGNLFLADSFDQTIFKFTPDGTRSVFVGPNAFGSNLHPEGLAFDSAGNLFVGEIDFANSSSDKISKFTPAGTESTFATGLNTVEGLAFDSLGNLFAAEVLDGDILKFTPNATETVFASGLNDPHWLTFGPAREGKVPDSGTTVGLLAISVLGLLWVSKIVTD